MKILTIAATPFFSSRGGHMRIYNEAKYLQKLGAEVRLCTYHLGEDIGGMDVVRIKGSQAYKKTSPGFSWGKIWLDWKLALLVRREIKRFRPDAIHAHLYEGLAVGYCAKKLAFARIPIVFDLQGDLAEEFHSYNKKNRLARKFFINFAKIVVCWADRIVSSSGKVRLGGREIDVVRDGIDLELFRNPGKLSAEEQERIENIKRWKGEKKLLVYVGGLSDNKGVGDLLAAFRIFASSNKEWKLLLGGFGKDEGGYKEFVRENNLEEQVYFAGKVNYFSLPHYLALATAGIDPKRDSTESSGKLVNLMAAGLPIICFRNGFNLVRLTEKGFYLGSFDNLPEVLAKIGSAVKIDYNLEESSEEKEARKLLEIFNRLIK